MRIMLTMEEIKQIAERLAQSLEPPLKAVARTIGASPQPVVGRDVVRDLAHELAPLVCAEDTLISADTARKLMGIRKSKWHELRAAGKIPDPVSTIVGDRWYRSTIIGCLAQELSETAANGEEPTDGEESSESTDGEESSDEGA